MAGAYYMWVNHGWTPSKFNNLPIREKLLIMHFIEKEVKARKKAEREINSG